MNPARLKAYLETLVVAIIWGVATAVIKYTLDGFSPLVFLTYRFGISTLVAIIITLVIGIHLPKKPSVLLQLVLYAFINSVVGLGFLFFGMENTSVLETSLITLSMPLIISTAGVYFLREHITKRERIGMLIAIVGMGLTIIEPLINNGHGALKLTGNLMVLGYVASSVITTILAKKILRNGVSPMTMVNLSFVLGFLSFLPFALKDPGFNLSQIISVPVNYHLGVLYMALISGTLAFYLSNKAQKTIEIGEASLFAYLYPLFSTPLAVLWLGEKITPTFVTGAVIITIGVAIAEIKKKRYN